MPAVSRVVGLLLARSLGPRQTPSPGIPTSFPNPPFHHDDDDKDDDGLGAGTIAAIVISTLIALATLVGLIIFFRHRRRLDKLRKRDRELEQQAHDAAIALKKLENGTSTPVSRTPPPMPAARMEARVFNLSPSPPLSPRSLPLAVASPYPPPPPPPAGAVVGRAVSPPPPYDGVRGGGSAVGERMGQGQQQPQQQQNQLQRVDSRGVSIRSSSTVEREGEGDELGSHATITDGLVPVRQDVIGVK
ncbi:hypothetical protein VTJ49DRAFT_1027 [Mycothermus thermophilus]|uniref:Uncharacterized protein n=1 Tax=Humicola insolens TaxID=85995 RepID=A0ABR3VDL0_HUMIN